MRCPKCKAATKTTDSRETFEGRRRRHACLSCEYRFSTIEILASQLDDARRRAREAMGRDLRKVLQAHIGPEKP